jgi:hypothetical protein
MSPLLVHVELPPALWDLWMWVWVRGGRKKQIIQTNRHFVKEANKKQNDIKIPCVPERLVKETLPH